MQSFSFAPDKSPSSEKLVIPPIIAAAKTQQELSSVYIDDLIYLAYPDETNKEINRK